MTTLEEQYKNDPDFNDWQKKKRRGQVMTGIFVIIAGLVYMFKQMGYLIPDWFFTWPTILIALGIIALVKNNFRSATGLILILIGSLFIASYAFPEFTIIHYKIPIILFIIGIILIFKPKNKCRDYGKFGYQKHRFDHKNYSGGGKGEYSDMVENSNEDYIFVNNVFAGTEKNIFSKDFKGGEIKNTFSGCKLNLMQAEIVTEAVLTIKQQFGGVKLVIPPNWVIKSDIECVFAGVEDKRQLLNVNDAAQKKTLILTGHIFMSGIEIVSY
jgi:predicted membrane protein